MTIILPPILSRPPTRTPSPQPSTPLSGRSSPKPTTDCTPSIPPPTPINPFTLNITSWEEWSQILSPPPLPLSQFLSTPPKIDFFCTPLTRTKLTLASSPLTFLPQKAGITLFPSDEEDSGDRQWTESSGPINLFDSMSYSEFKSMVKEDRSEETPVEKVVGGIWAGDKGRGGEERFEVEWPSEEI